MKIKTNSIWCIIVISLVLVFPIQVFTKSPLPSLIPFLLLGFFVRNYKREKVTKFQFFFNLILTFYLGFYSVHFLFQIIINEISIGDMLGSVVIYFLPYFFYYFFKKSFTLKSLDSILYAISITGILVGLYFVYDSFSKLIFGEIPYYSTLVSEYEIFRKNSMDINNTRIKVYERAYGLLESHSVSAAWISISCFSSLCLVPINNIKTRNIIIAIYFMFLLIGLNFTSIISFILVMIIFEFNLFNKKINLFRLLSLFVFFSIVIFFGILILDHDSQNLLLSLFNYFLDLFSGDLITRDDGKSYFGAMFSGFINFPNLMYDKFPLGLFFGDGFFNEFGLTKGGDYGILESLYRFGIIPFLCILFFLIKIFLRFYKTNNKYLKFALVTLVYIFFVEFHYSVWNSKPIIAVIFIAFAVIYKLSDLTNTKLND